MFALSTTGIVGRTGALVGVMAIPAWLSWRRPGVAERQSFLFCFAWGGLAPTVNLVVFGFTSSWLYLRGLPYILVVLLVLIAGSGPAPVRPGAFR